MQPEVRKLLFDMLHAVLGVDMFVAGRTMEDFKADLMLRLAVERQFEIIGEALGRLVKTDETTAQRISEHRRIIGFRNVLIHGYDDIDDEITWRIVQDKLPVLRKELQTLLAEDTTP